MIIQKDGATLFIDDKGATISRFQIGSVDVIYPLQMRKAGDNVKLRGGVPIPFPWFGPWEGHLQHGFLREIPLMPEPEYNKGTCAYRLDWEAINPILPEDFGYPEKIRMGAQFSVDEGMLAQQIVVHPGPCDPDAPFNAGFHPYFCMPGREAVVRVGRKEVVVSQGNFKLGHHIQIDGPMVNTTVRIKGLGTLTLHAYGLLGRSEAKTLIWTDDLDYLCVEPVLDDVTLFGTKEGFKLGDLSKTRLNAMGYTCKVELEN